MERNYFEQPAHQFQTPRLHVLNCPESKTSIHTWLCSPENTMDQSKWFYSVEVRHEDLRVERHYFLEYVHALRYRYHRAAVDVPMMVVDQPQDIMNILHQTEPERIIAQVDFKDTPVWDGYTLQEVLTARK